MTSRQTHNSFGGLAAIDEKEEEEDFEESFTISDEQHYRSSIIAVGHILHLPDDQIPTDERQGLLRHADSIAEEATIDNFCETENAKEDTSLLLKKQSSTRRAEISLLHSALQEIDKVANKRIQDGLNEWNFTCGVLNTVIVVWVFGVYPENFWLLYLVEGLYLLPSRFFANKRTTPLSSVLFFTDYCWVMNMLALVILVVFVVDSLIGVSGSQSIHKQLFLAAVGTACGPLLGACLVLPFVCLMFHDVNALSGFFIHMFPPLVMYTLLWNANDIREAWPQVFYLDYMEDMTFFSTDGRWPLGLDSIAGNTLMLYALWWLLYVGFMLLIGMDLPRYNRKRADGTAIVPKYDTCFHNFMRAGLCIVLGSKFWKRSKAASLQQMESNHFEARDFFLYMLAHAIMAIASIFCIAYPCVLNRAVHASFLFFVAVVTVYRGAKRYTYYSIHMYSNTLRKQFAHLIDEERGKP